MKTDLIASDNKDSKYAVRYAKKLIALQPGIGDTGNKVVEELTKSGLPPSTALMLIDVVYNPRIVAHDAEGPVVSGRGQATRLRWFSMAVVHRFGHRLEKARTDVKSFRNILLDLSEVEEIRANTDISVSFEEAFMLFEAGIDADEFSRLVDELNYRTPFAPKKKILRAIRAVEAGEASTVEGYLEMTDFRRIDE